ncbi:UTRA domain-containing protein [Roseiflexus sp.]|uniref:UTRA domain-containing protein n=1 Tax=Roseiflexus sp. TaxID=2562120 RepID=UPI00398B723F
MQNSRAKRSIEAAPASEIDVKLLHIEPGAPILIIERLVTSAANEPIEFLQARYRGDRFKCQISD